MEDSEEIAQNRELGEGHGPDIKKLGAEHRLEKYREYGGTGLVRMISEAICYI